MYYVQPGEEESIFLIQNFEIILLHLYLATINYIL